MVLPPPQSLYEMILSSGSRLGPYEIVGALGAGGMGEVFRARDTRLERNVAIKILPAAFAHNSNFRARFDREAKTISQLNHPHICQIYDVGESGPDTDSGALRSSSPSTLYLVMELLDGETLSDRLARGPLPLADVLRYGSQIAAALAAAHRAGIVHRDLKPGNIMITKAGAKLLDFGLAKLVAEPTIEADAPTEHHKPLTAEGTILGTFQYMAPEQLEGTEADPRTDIFALGVVLYEMASGRRAFAGKTRTSLIAAIVASSPTPLKEFQPLTPPQLEHVIFKCLEKDPDQRWQSTHDISEELKWISSGGTTATAQAGTRTRRRAAALMMLLLVGGVALGALITSFLRRDQQPLVYSSILGPKGVEIGTAGEQRTVLSPDGRSLAFVGREAKGKQRIWIRSMDSHEARAIVGTEDGFHLFWSPDNRSIGFFANGKLKTVSLNGSPPITLCDVLGNPRGGAWNQEGVILFAPGSLAPLHRINASGGRSSAVTKFDTQRGENTHRWPRFLPDGKSFLYMAGSNAAAENSDLNAIYASSLGSVERKLILHTRYHVEYADGKLLFVRGNTLFAQRFDPSKLELEGDPVEIAEGIFTDSNTFAAAFSASAEDRLLYVTGIEKRKAELLWIDAAGKELAKVLQPGEYGRWSVSPNGKTVAISIIDPSAGENIWLQDLERGTLTPLNTGGSASDPVWSPDGKRIAYTGSQRQLLVQSVESDAKAEEIWIPRGWAGPTGWSPDGTQLAVTTFDAASAKNYDVVLLPLGPNPRPIPIATTMAEEYAGSFSPDGRWLSYVSKASGRHELYVISRDLQHRQQISVGGGGRMIWRSLREIWYDAYDGRVLSVTVEELNGRLQVSTPRLLFTDKQLTGFRAVPGADDRFLVTRLVGDEQAPPETVLVTNWPELLKAPAR